MEPGIKWRNNHWRTIESAYRKAPYFDFYAGELREILYQDHKLLLNLNLDLLSFCLKNLRIQKNITVTDRYENHLEGSSFDLRSIIQQKTDSSERNYYLPKKYYQVFGNEFVENLSIIDLLFCEGPRATEIIQASSRFLNK